MYASVVALLSMLAIAYLTYIDSAVALFVVLAGGVVSGLLYGMAFRFKGLLLSLLIGVLFGLGAFAGVAARPYTPGGGEFGFLLAGLRFVIVPIVGAGGLVTSLIGGVIGALMAGRKARR